MKILIKYCGYCRNDGTYNEVGFDTETKTYSNWVENEPDRTEYAFVEAYMSRDVNSLRRSLNKEGYVCIDKE